MKDQHTDAGFSKPFSLAKLIVALRLLPVGAASFVLYQHNQHS